MYAFCPLCFDPVAIDSSPRKSVWPAQQEKNRAGKRYHERRKEKPKAKP